MRNLLILATVVGSAVIGTGVALTGTLRQASVQQASVQQASVQPVLPIAQATIPAPQIAPSPAPTTPIAQVISQPTQPEPLFPPPAPAPDPMATATSISPLRAQLRRAIQERNLAMLKSLLQAGSLREALRDVEAQEQINLDNLDASAWRVLEKAINYRCRTQTNGEQSACFE